MCKRFLYTFAHFACPFSASSATGNQLIIRVFSACALKNKKGHRPLRPTGVRLPQGAGRQPVPFSYTYVASTTLVPDEGILKPAKAQKADVLCIYIQSTRSAPHDLAFTFMTFRP